jgi:hypothetical protein
MFYVLLSSVNPANSYITGLTEKRYRVGDGDAKISHLVTSLSTSRQQVVFALLVTNCQQVVNNL